ncbi:cobalamin-binding protein [uncultured Paraglaciecola sp.]|uniref:cobalamin-binding protein n=1 Tax=uncultured Paraglaciecola sp. TaxID=1765024 RepID=UPI0025EDF7A7|nr:cobalamin-binding protein [uncultured Paraglaciecola sp.]
MSLIMNRYLNILLLGLIGLNASQTVAKSVSDDSLQKQRIIALAPHIVESLYAIGAGEQIIGTTAHADYPKAAENILRVGNYARLQIEKIIQLKPDVIIAWKTGNPMDDLARLEKYQLKVVYSHPQTLEDVANELIMLGKITGREAVANSVAKKYLLNLQKIKQKYATQNKVRVFYELWSRPLRTVANKAWPQQQIELCGASNPFADAQDDYPSVGLEQVLVTLPQVVIQPGQHSADSPDGLNWLQWQHIPAVKNNFIFHPNADKAHRMTIRMLDEVVVLCEQIDAARQFYQAQS